ATYFVATGISQYLGSVVANLAKMPSHDLPATASLPLYVHLFTTLGWVGVGGTLVSCLLLPLMAKLSRAHHNASTERKSGNDALQANGAAPRHVARGRRGPPWRGACAGS
ncbi:hypothetical protein PPH41_36855, partial [Burkholderia gladioli]|nr:hypothetical protein [Burkholderia gladioli]